MDPDLVPHQHEKWNPDPHQNVLDLLHCNSQPSQDSIFFTLKWHPAPCKSDSGKVLGSLKISPEGGVGRETCVQDISLIAPFSKDFSSRLFTNQILSNFVNTLAENYTINKYIHKTYEVTRIVCTFDCYLHDIALEKSRK